MSNIESNSEYKILVNSKNLLKDVDQLGNQLANDFKNEFLCSITLKGGEILYNLLNKNLNLTLGKIQINLNNFSPTSKLDLSSPFSKNLANKNLLIIDGIIISGKTHLNLIENLFKFKPKSITLVSLAKKTTHLDFNKIKFYSIYTFEKEFVAGCGIGKPPLSEVYSLYDIKNK